MPGLAAAEAMSRVRCSCVGSWSKTQTTWWPRRYPGLCVSSYPMNDRPSNPPRLQPRGDPSASAARGHEQAFPRSQEPSSYDAQGCSAERLIGDLDSGLRLWTGSEATKCGLEATKRIGAQRCCGASPRPFITGRGRSQAQTVGTRAGSDTPYGQESP